ncbi:hypothetical protein EAF04_003620 [Stromatinia cepivora]|nr:hypothetical protein EAF04_003620 [Stromatinia cepivora]
MAPACQNRSFNRGGRGPRSDSEKWEFIGIGAYRILVQEPNFPDSVLNEPLDPPSKGSAFNYSTVKQEEDNEDRGLSSLSLPIKDPIQTSDILEWIDELRDPLTGTIATMRADRVHPSGNQRLRLQTDDDAGLVVVSALSGQMQRPTLYPVGFQFQKQHRAAFRRTNRDPQTDMFHLPMLPNAHVEPYDDFSTCTLFGQFSSYSRYQNFSLGGQDENWANGSVVPTEEEKEKAFVI